MTRPLPIAAQTLHRSTRMDDAKEIYHLRPGTDGLTRITARCLGERVRRSWIVPTAEAEGAVLDEWAELHDRALGFPPNW